jgi:Flp pilus assembly protein protease CpaA
MDYILLLFLPMILFIGVITSYEDIKTGKIRNKWIIYGLIYAVIMNLLIIFIYIYLVYNQTLRIGYFVEYFLNVIFALLLGFILWNIGLWTAGDAKLFMVFSALIPLSVFHYGHIPYFDANIILINTFVPFFIFYSIMLLFKTSFKQKIYYLKKSFEIKQIMVLFLFLFGFMWPLGIIFRYTNLPRNFFFSIFILFIILNMIEKILKNRLVLFLLIISVFRLFLDSNAFTLYSFVNLLVLLISFLLLRYFILYIGYDFMTKIVDIKLLKKGMVPAEFIVIEKGKYVKKPLLHFSLLSYMMFKKSVQKTVFNVNAEGLIEKDVKTLKKLEKKLGFEHLRVYKTLSFAPYMFVGVLLTLIFKGNLFVALF